MSEQTKKIVKSKPLKSHLTVVETVYIQSHTDEPESVESRFTRELETNEQLYKRRLLVTPEWKALDTGWVSDLGMLVISNQEGAKLLTNPTEEEKQATKLKIVELSSDTNSEFHWKILPGESIRVVPSDASKLFIRCYSGDALIIVNAFPN